MRLIFLLCTLFSLSSYAIDRKVVHKDRRGKSRMHYESEARTIAYESREAPVLCRFETNDEYRLGVGPGYRYISSPEKMGHFTTLGAHFHFLEDRLLFDWEGLLGLHLKNKEDKIKIIDRTVASYASLGCNYPMFQKRVILSPVMGAGYDAFWARNHEYKTEWTGPFVGSRFQIRPFKRVNLDLGYGYHFLHVVQKNESDTIREISSWKGRGHRGHMNVNVSLSENVICSLLSSVQRFSHEAVARLTTKTEDEKWVSRIPFDESLFSSSIAIQSTLFF